MYYKCPHCEEKIYCVTYNTNGYEYGNYDPNSQDYDHRDFCHDGVTTYYCPECEEEIMDPDHMEKVEDEDEDKDKPDSILDLIAPILVPEKYNDHNMILKNCDMDMGGIVRCRCGFGYEFEESHRSKDREQKAECSNCGRIIRNPACKKKVEPVYLKNKHPNLCHTNSK